MASGPVGSSPDLPCRNLHLYSDLGFMQVLSSSDLQEVLLFKRIST